MGLSICRSIVEVHNGKMIVSQRVPHGVRFTIAIPTYKAGGGDHEVMIAAQAEVAESH